MEAGGGAGCGPPLALVPAETSVAAQPRAEEDAGARPDEDDGAMGGQARAPRDWVRLENRHYRRATLHDGGGAAPLARALVACAPCAGPVAVIGDSGWGLAPLTVFAANGALVGRYASVRRFTAAPVRAVALGWADEDALAVVYQDGYVVWIALPGAAVDGGRVSEPRPVTVVDPESGRPKHVVDAAVLPQGHLVARTASGALFATARGGAPEPFGPAAVPPPAVLGERLCVAGTLVALGGDDGVEAVLCVGEGGALARVDAAKVLPAAGEQVHERLAMSPDQDFVASVLVDGHVVVRNARTLTQVVYVVIPAHYLPLTRDMPVARPDSLAWVGVDSVAVTFGEALLLIGPGGAVAPCPMTGDLGGGVVLHTEKDGLRVVTRSKCEFVQMVPECVEAVLVRKDSPSSKLLRASIPECCVPEDEAVGGSRLLSDAVGDVSQGECALERYRLLTELRERDELGKAASKCVEAATLCWNPREQKTLLNAAVYGQRYDLVLGGVLPDGVAIGSGTDSVLPGSRVSARRPSMSSDRGVPLAIATLRILAAVRAPEVGLPVTKPQLVALGYAGLVRRLSDYGKHALSVRLAAFCGVSPDYLLASWARDRFVTQEPDEVVAGHIFTYFEQVRQMFGRIGKPCSRLPYVTAAEDAFSAGRQRCAEILLRRETSPARKVPLYMKMRAESLALLAAIASSDNEVILDVIDELRRSKSIREMATLLKKLPSSMSHRATDLMVVHMRESGEMDNVRSLLQDLGRNREAAMEVIDEADSIQDPKARLTSLEKLSSSLGRWGTRRSTGFEVQALQQAVSSEHLAMDLEKKFGLAPRTLAGTTSTEILSFAAAIRDPARRRDSLMRTRRDLKIPERRFFWVVLEALVEARDMSAVEALSNSGTHNQPPVIGLTAFVEVCLRHGEETEATKYAWRISDVRDRARALARCGNGKEAAEIAAKIGSQQLMQEVESYVAEHSAGIEVDSAYGLTES